LAVVQVNVSQHGGPLVWGGFTTLGIIVAPPKTFPISFNVITLSLLSVNFVFSFFIGSKILLVKKVIIQIAYRFSALGF
jgi:hypothetical protein